MGGFNLREIMDSARTFRCGGHRSSRKNGVPANVNGMSILQLPPEVLIHIFAHLTAKDITSVALACKTFYETTQIDKLWQALCWKECGVILPAAAQPQPYMKRMFTKILYKYKTLFGLWQPDITNYGGLVQVKFEDEKIVGYEWKSPSDPFYTDPMKRRDLFSITLTADGEVQVNCLRGFYGPHKCQIIVRNKNNFYSKCCFPDYHRHPRSDDEEFQEWVREETSNVARFRNSQNHDLLFIKFLFMKQYEFSYEHHRLFLPAARPQVLIQPGIFKGTYGDNGLELVVLSYEDDGYTIKATKITGDQNVPVNKVSFRADMRYSIVLNEQQQMDMEALNAVKRSSSCVLPENLPVQPFCVPVSCAEEGVYVPSQCKARFHGFGQIAGHGFTNSSYTPGHWIVFSDDLFGFLWLSLHCLSLFHRVTEPFY